MRDSIDLSNFILLSETWKILNMAVISKKKRLKARLDQSLLFFSGLVKKATRFFLLTNKKSILFHKVVVFIFFYLSGIPCNAAIQKKKHHKSRESNTTKDFEGHVITLLRVCLLPLSISQSRDVNPSKTQKTLLLVGSPSLPLRFSFSVPFSFYLSQTFSL